MFKLDCIINKIDLELVVIFILVREIDIEVKNLVVFLVFWELEYCFVLFSDIIIFEDLGYYKEYF